MSMLHAFTKESRGYFRLGRGEPQLESGTRSEELDVRILLAFESWEVT